MAKAETSTKVFEMMDQQSTKSEAAFDEKEELHNPVKSNRKRYL